MALTMIQKIRRAETAMREMPQVELETKHYFADGMYAREVFRPAGTFIIGKVHKREHFYIVTKGAVQVASADGLQIYEAPAVVVSKPGTKRAVLALEDSVCMTVHRTDNTDLDAIEKELIEEDQRTLYDAANHLKRRALP